MTGAVNGFGVPPVQQDMFAGEGMQAGPSISRFHVAGPLPPPPGVPEPLRGLQQLPQVVLGDDNSVAGTMTGVLTSPSRSERNTPLEPPPGVPQPPEAKLQPQPPLLSSRPGSAAGAAPPKQQDMAVLKAVSSVACSLGDVRGTRLAELLLLGVLQVVKGSYFVSRQERGELIQMRQEVAPEHFWDGHEVVKMWERRGAEFLMAVSHAWLGREHPDPQAIHLQRLVGLIKDHWRQYHWVGEIGVVIDYCCLPQPRLVNGISRFTEAEQVQLRAALEEVHTLFGHTRIGVWCLEQVPPHIPRRYGDRGWIMFERALIDGKGGSVLAHAEEANIRVSKEPEGREEEPRPLALGPPLTPDRFERELHFRAKSTLAKGVPFFSNESEDMPLVQRKYRDFFALLVKADALEYPRARHWGPEEADALLEALPAFKVLWRLRVHGLRPEVGARLARGLVKLLDGGACRRLWIVDVQGCSPEEAAALGVARTRRREEERLRMVAEQRRLREHRPSCVEAACWCCCSRTAGMSAKGSEFETAPSAV